MISARAIKDQLSEGSGFWRSCSGCYETVDGYSGQVPDPTFRCELGTGCHECGGLGAIWDDIDYGDMAAFMMKDSDGDVVARANAGKQMIAGKSGIDRNPDDTTRGSRPAATVKVRPSETQQGIYIASKTKHADRWRFIRDKAGTPVISTWIDEAGVGESSDLDDLWRRCIHEASHCQVLIVYREKDDVLKGGWVEVGAALAVGIPVYAVGLEDFTIANFSGITHFRTMKKAVTAALATSRTAALTPAVSPHSRGGS